MYKISPKILFLIFFFILVIVQLSHEFGLQYLYNLYFDFYDLKWSGAKLFLENLNIYEIYFENPSDKRIKGHQYPNYSIGSIYLHLPFGFMSWEFVPLAWRILSTILIIHIYILLTKNNLNIKNQNLIVFISMFLLVISKPFNILINNGNFSIICLWSFIYYFYGSRINILTTLFICSVKYSFFPILFFYSILNKYFIQLFLVLLISILLIINFSIKFDSSFFEIMFSPIKVGASSTASGFLDYQTFMGNHPNNLYIRYFLIILSSFLIFFIIYKNTIRNKLFDLCLISFVTVIFYKHLYYDMVFLLPLLIYSFKIKKKLKYIPIFIIIYFWFLTYSDILYTIRYWKSFLVFNNLMLLICFYVILSFHKKFND